PMSPALRINQGAQIAPTTRTDLVPVEPELEGRVPVSQLEHKTANREQSVVASKREEQVPGPLAQQPEHPRVFQIKTNLLQRLSARSFVVAAAVLHVLSPPRERHVAAPHVARPLRPQYKQALAAPRPALSQNTGHHCPLTGQCGGGWW